MAEHPLKQVRKVMAKQSLSSGGAIGASEVKVVNDGKRLQRLG